MNTQQALTRIEQISADAMTVYLEHARKKTKGFKIECAPELKPEYSPKTGAKLLALAFESACQHAGQPTHDQTELVPANGVPGFYFVPKNVESWAENLACSLRYFAKVSKDQRFSELADEATRQAARAIEKPAPKAALSETLSAGRLRDLIRGIERGDIRTKAEAKEIYGAYPSKARGEINKSKHSQKLELLALIDSLSE